MEYCLFIQLEWDSALDSVCCYWSLLRSLSIRPDQTMALKILAAIAENSIHARQRALRCKFRMCTSPVLPQHLSRIRRALVIKTQVRRQSFPLGPRILVLRLRSVKLGTTRCSTLLIRWLRLEIRPSVRWEQHRARLLLPPARDNRAEHDRAGVARETGTTKP